MSLILVVKSTGSIWHWMNEGFVRNALCGDHPKRGHWRKARHPELLTGKVICPTCAKIKAARDQQRQDITEGLMVAQAVEASRYEP